MNGSVAVVGLGKLGLPIACAIAHRGFRVTGVDVDQARVDALRKGTSPLIEPGLHSLLGSVGERFTVTTDIVAAVRACELIMIFVPTPSLEDGSFALDHALDAARSIGEAMRAQDDYKVVVVNSTVSPGSTEGAIRTVLETTSGKACGVGFGLCYSPEFVALGAVIANFLRPDVVLIGQSDERAGSVLAEVYAKVCENDPPVVRMGVVNAEIAKLAVNTYITTKISFANMLADLCERIPGGDVDAVTEALGMDSRIGPRYLKGGLGYGGPCFPRDNRALSRFARDLGVDPSIPEATDATNRAHNDHVIARVTAEVGAASRVAILGLTYRPETDIVEESPGIALADALTQAGVEVVAFDPLATEAARERLDASVRVAGSVADCVSGADAVILSMPWDGAAEALSDVLHAQGPTRSAVVFDCWRALDPSTLPSGCRYVALGRAAGTERS